jgi:3-phenylpropionate/trans-cinnamate dioxygenase ferredoxin subunit
MSWTRAVAEGDVEVGKVVVVEAGDTRIAICHTGEGYYAVDDVCSHDGGALDQGELFGDRIECPRHGAQFDVKTGRALTLPAVRPIASYPVRVVDGAVEIDVD